MSDLTTVENVAGYLPFSDLGVVANTDGSPLNKLLKRLISSTSAFIESNMNRIFEPAIYTEVRNGHNEYFLTFSDYPVQSVKSVTVDGQDISAQEQWGSPGYSFDATVISLHGGYRFWKGRQNIVLVYQAGYDTIPYEVEQVCIDLVCRKYKERDRIGVHSKVLNGETINFSKTDMTDELKSVLRAYQKVVPV